MTKEDKIRIILLSGSSIDKKTKEIATLFENMYEGKFIEWLEMRRDHFWGRVESIDELLFVNFAEGSKKKFTLDEVYLLWLALPENKNKEK